MTAITAFCRFWSFPWSVATFASLAALLGAITQAAAYSTDCECAVYASSDGDRAVVMSEKDGWVDEIKLDSQPILGSRKRIGISEKDLRDCGSAEIRCLDWVRAHIILAFKRGRAGETYSVNGVRYSIERVGSLPHAAATNVWWVRFSGAAPAKSGTFVYTDGRGIALIALDNSAAPLVLVSGDGLLKN